MRRIAHLAALIGLGAFAVALGDFLSGPNVLGAAGLCVLGAALALALAQLYRPGGWGSPQPRRPRADAAAAPAGEVDPDAPLWAGRRDKPTRPRRRAPRPSSPSADAGWDAREAESSRERGREERSARKRNQSEPPSARKPDGS